ncbi:MAG: NUDIX hydrolase [Chloroflexi bacterium]|nr:NUDIX hydrolase [Chloroflexota bacterium]
MELRPWTVLDAEHLLSAPPWLEVYREQVQLPGGRVLDDFYRVVMPEFAVVAAVTPDGQLVMVRGYRHGPRRIVLSAPAGLVEPGETPLAAAQRELLEETGYAATDWTSLGRFVVDSNRQGGTAHIFLARQARPVTAGNQDDDTEIVQVELLDPRQFGQAIHRGEIALLASAAAIALALTVGLE